MEQNEYATYLKPELASYHATKRTRSVAFVLGDFRGANGDSKMRSEEIVRSVYVALNAEEMKALLVIAGEELRPPREQMRQLLRQEAQRRGLLASAGTVVQGQQVQR